MTTVKNAKKASMCIYPSREFHSLLKDFLEKYGTRRESMNIFVLESAQEALKFRMMKEGLLPVCTKDVEAKIKELKDLLVKPDKPE